MENTLVVALAITAVGMTLLFLALALFYGLLSLMMSVLEVRAKPEAPEPTEQPATESKGLLRAAAVAVALARSEARQGVLPASMSVREKDTDSQSLSPWWSLHHQRQMTHKPNVRRLP